MDYTPMQEKVIETRDRNLLVSASAGSGKTAVLIERILQKMLRKEEPVSIDELLIVTFTHAAADEMRERLAKAVEKSIEEAKDPMVMNHLVRQMTLIPSANIMTLHSFCLRLIKSYYYLLELDPNFRIGNETELVLMKEEVLDELLEESYKDASPSFLQVIESYAYGKDDQPIRDLILKLYQFSMSHPWPEKWLEQSLAFLKASSMEELFKTPYMHILLEEVSQQLQGAKTLIHEIQELMSMDQGPDKYAPTVDVLENIVKGALESLEDKDISEVMEIYNNTSIPSLSLKRKGYDKELAAEAKSKIDQVKEAISSIDLLAIDEDVFEKELPSIEGLVKEVVHLMEVFKEEYRIKKDDKSLIDFSDVEHMALQLLYDQERGIADTYKKQFKEILVDEYQDINEVQETILQAVSNGKNLFMVGDIKQSIYKFRLAKPEIFRKKYETFKDDDEQNMRIDLSKNFRSRKQVLNFVNEIFGRLMNTSLGDVDYNENAALHFGATDYEDSQESEKDVYRAEICILEDPKEGETKVSLQAEYIAGRIERLVKHEKIQILDKEKGIRDINYGDICILLRSPGRAMADLKDVFERRQIPYSSDVSTGYFDAIEVQMILNYLRVIDNPLQDIAMTSILRAPFWGFDEQDLVDIRMDKEKYVFENMKDYLYIHENEEDKFTLKLMEFMDAYRRLCHISKTESLYELIRRIYQLTGYRNTVSLMDKGPQRRLNLDYLLFQAMRFEESSYKGVFNFIRYIEHMQKYASNQDEPRVGDYGQEQVRFMSIHKSKGLEFPLVFVMDIHKQFNMQDFREPILMHQSLGLASDYIDIGQRIKRESIYTKALKIVGKKEALSEELRILYVALTRAREKLILVGVVDDYEKKVYEKKKSYQEGAILPLSPLEGQKARSILDWILISCPFDEISSYHYEAVLPDMIMDEENLQRMNVKEEKKALVEWLQEGQQVDQEQLERDFEILTKPYAHIDSVKKYQTLSVSEIKRNRLRDMQEEEMLKPDFEKILQRDKSANIRVADMDIQVKKPRFLQEENPQKQSGALYGQLFHKVLSRLPLEDSWSFGSMRAYLEQLEEIGQLEKEEKERLSVKSLVKFTESDLYHRMVSANQRAKLYRERPFVLMEQTDDDRQMVQGIVDVYFDEEGQWVLVDYKTDYVPGRDIDFLKERYSIQLEYYKKALEEITKKKVKETILYSLYLQEQTLM